MFTAKTKSDVDVDMNVASLAISFRYEVYTQAFHLMWIREQAFDINLSRSNQRSSFMH